MSIRIEAMELDKRSRKDLVKACIKVRAARERLADSIVALELKLSSAQRALDRECRRCEKWRFRFLLAAMVLTVFVAVWARGR